MSVLLARYRAGSWASASLGGHCDYAARRT